MTSPTKARRATLPAEIKEPWIAALRSGEFKQGQGQLWGAIRDDDCNPTDELGYCCMGVLCKVMGWQLADADGRTFTGISSGPPELVGDGVSTESIVPPGPDADHWVGTVSGLTYANRAFLAQLNDSGTTFDEIADVIEREF